ncbi:YsnF/AvaK domain-containing protein [Actinoplanes sp. RD1]|uniref:YsnF/AvaK domain-containing protein n=1 Tax=Actinoplanes sp. RD1 TaxID=3064538 RepID=UPI0027413BED|nr:YsnF/AvaK domain-containing protein [Actinoplanes sp. RD1]
MIPEQPQADGTDDAMTRSEQRLVAGTEVYETGRARLRKYVVTEDVQITVQVRREELRLERAPAGGSAPVADPDVFGTLEEFGGPDGGVVFEITLHEERPVVTTEVVPVERVRLSKLVQSENHIVTGEVLKERIEADLPGRPPTTFG